MFILWEMGLGDANRLILNASVGENKRKFLQECLSTGEEGCVLKWKKGKYEPGATRNQLDVNKELEKVSSSPIEVKEKRLGGRKRIWTYKGNSEEVDLVRKGAKNSRVKRRNKSTRVVPNEELSE